MFKCTTCSRYSETDDKCVCGSYSFYYVVCCSNLVKSDWVYLQTPVWRMKCRVCKEKSYFLSDPCECGPVHLRCLTGDRCSDCSKKYVLPDEHSWVPFVVAPVYAFIHGWMDHLDPSIGVIPRTLIIGFCQAVYCSLLSIAYSQRAVFLPAIPVSCMFVYVSVILFYHDFYWYSVLQAYMFFFQGVCLYYHGPV